MAELLLGVNIDHLATLRNARGTAYPDPVQAAFIANNQTFVFQLPFHGTNYTVTQNASAS